MPSIVISYRRADTGQIVGRIFDRLEAHFGRDSVFMDIDGVPIGADFRERVQSVLDKCDVVLAVIGPHWADGGQSRDRLADDADWVRIEIETALAKKVPVIPVLIDQAQLPAGSQLPQSVRDIIFKQAARLDTGVDFGVHMERLIRALEGTAGTVPASHAAPPTHNIAPGVPAAADAATSLVQFFSFGGRISRKRWWDYAIPYLLMPLFAVWFCKIAFTPIGHNFSGAVLPWIVLVLIAVSLWISLAGAVKRLRDRNISSIFALFPIVTLASVIWAMNGTDIVQGSMTIVAFGTWAYGLFELGFRGGTVSTSTTPNSSASFFSNRNIAICIGAAVAVVIAVALVVLWPRPTPNVDTADMTDSPAMIPPPPAPSRGGDILQTMESAPLNADVRTAFERARSASAAAMHATNDARDAKLRARQAALKAVSHTPGYGDIDDTTGSGAARHYSGSIRASTPDGYGIVSIPSLGSTYSGQLDDGAITGNGVLSKGDFLFEGQFRDGKFDGVGVITIGQTQGAERISGEFKNGELDGDGLHLFGPGHIYFGQWIGGRRNGYGVTYGPDGALIEQGIYKEDALVRPLTPDK